VKILSIVIRKTCIAIQTKVEETYHCIPKFDPVQYQHGQNDPCLALPHVELNDGTRMLQQIFSDEMLRWSYLKEAFGLEDQPFGVTSHLPGPVHLQFLEIREKNKKPL
jgi:hypothetical protein